MISTDSSFLDSVRIALTSMWTRRLQSSLTMLGILIGNASFISMIALGEGAKKFMLAELESFGPNRVSIFTVTPENMGFPVNQPTMTLDDIDAILKGAPAVKAAAPQISSDVWQSSKGKTIKVNAVGTSYDHLPVHNMSVASGRFFLSSEQQADDKVVVLGSANADKLFGQQDPVNREIKLNNISFRVVGVLESRGAVARFDPDDGVYLPVTTMAKHLVGRRSAKGIPIDYVAVSAVSREAIPDAAFQIQNILLWRHKRQDFAIRTNRAILDLILRVSTVLTLMLASTSLISMVVGGIGIMNVMLVSVAQRTSEIGICKAVGARSSWVMRQFLIEAVILSAAGGALGIVIGVSGITAMATFSPLKPSVPPWSIVLSLALSGGVGLVFGVIPARNASRLDPIIALRSA